MFNQPDSIISAQSISKYFDFFNEHDYSSEKGPANSRGRLPAV
jgi:hypothetical protein